MTDNTLQIARGAILEPAGLDEGHIQRLLDGIMGRAVDAADIYFQYSRHESWP
jgi:TldD protein